MTMAIIIALSFSLVAMTCVAIAQTLRLRWQMLLTSGWKAGAESWEAVANRWEQVANDILDAEAEFHERKMAEPKADAFVWFDHSATMDKWN